MTLLFLAKALKSIKGRDKEIMEENPFNKSKTTKDEELMRSRIKNGTTETGQTLLKPVMPQREHEKLRRHAMLGRTHNLLLLI